MQRGTAGFIGGVIAGFIKLVIEQIFIGINILKSNMPGTISNILFGASGKLIFLSWIIYVLLTGLAGWVLSKIILSEKKYVFTGVISGIVIWSLMNVVFMLVGITPTWAMGLSTCVITFFTHILLGFLIVYSVYKFSSDFENKKLIKIIIQLETFIKDI